MRRRGVGDLTTANAFLAGEYWADHNARFAQASASPEDYHGRPPSARVLDRVLRLEEPRVVANDWVVRYHNRLFQLDRQSPLPPAKGTVLVREDAAGHIEIHYRQRAVSWTELPATPPTPRPTSVPAPPRTRVAAGRVTAHGPGPNHPWARSQDFALMREVAAVRQAYAANHRHPGDISIE